MQLDFKILVLLFGVVIDQSVIINILINKINSRPVIRGSYRSDTLINSITTKVQALFWLSKTVTTNTMLLYEMSLFDKYYDNFLYIKSILHLIR